MENQENSPGQSLVTQQDGSFTSTLTNGPSREIDDEGIHFWT